MCNACGLELFMLNPPGAVIRSEHCESLLTTVALKKKTIKQKKQKNLPQALLRMSSPAESQALLIESCCLIHCPCSSFNHRM